MDQYEAKASRDRPPYYSEERVGSSPEEMPEVAREVTIMRGAIIALSNRLEELLPQLEPVCRQTPGVERDPGPEATTPAAFTPLGQELRDMSKVINELEDRVTRVLLRVAL